MKKPKFLKNLLDAKTMINESDHGGLLIEVKGDLLKQLQNRNNIVYIFIRSVPVCNNMNARSRFFCNFTGN